MHAYVRRALCAVGLTGGVVLLGIGLAEAASADGASGPVTNGDSGIVSGNQTGANVQAPVNVSGNQVTVIGQRNKVSSTGGAATTSGSPGSPTTSGQDGIGSGNQTAVHAQVPVNASGNQVTVIGQDNKVASTGSSSSSGTSTGSAGSPTTSGESGIGSGNQTAVDLQVPVNVSGNQVTVIGQDNEADSTGGSATATPAAGSSGAPTTSGQDAILSGNQTGVGLQVPINISGNQVTVIGQRNTTHATGGSATGHPAAGPSAGPTTSGEDGVGSGNQTGIGVEAPIAATGNQVTVIGQDNTLTSTGTTTTGGSTGPGETTTGAGGVGSGNQTPIDVQAPVDTSGNQVTVVGQDNTDTSTSGSTSGGTTAGGTPPGGTVVSPPSTGGTTGTQAAAAPAASGLPNTGAPAGLLGAGLLGLLLVLLGGGLLRREGAIG
jgi:ChpA-C